MGHIAAGTLDPQLYAADVSDLLAIVHEVSAEVETLHMVGHNPGLEELVLEQLITSRTLSLVA